MKKLIGILTLGAMFSVVACGPSAKEQKAIDEKVRKESDSIADVLTKQMYGPSDKKDTTKKDASAVADTTKKK
jgi:hypothetical protein